MGSTGSDVVVVGCGPAGAVVSTLLARAGHRVTVLDRDLDPERGLLVLTRPGSEVLDDLGWLAGLSSLPGARRESRLELIGAEDRVRLPVGWLVVPRRAAVDSMADGADRAGATLVPGLAAVAPLWKNRRVVGVRARDAGGGDHELTARVVVDASGREALLPHLLGHVLPRPGPRRVRIAATGANGASGGLELAVIDRQWLLAAPTEEGAVSAVLRRMSLPGRDEDIGELEQVVDGLVGSLWGGLRIRGEARRVGLHLRTHAGDGWVAVGEAGGCGGPGLPSVSSTGLARAASAAWEVDLCLRAGREVGADELGATVTLGRQTVFFDSYLERVMARVAAVGQLRDAAARPETATHLVSLLGGEWAVHRGRVGRLLFVWRLDRRARRELRRRRRTSSPRGS